METTVKSNLCTECQKTFKRFSELRRHVKNFHSTKLDEIAPIKKKFYPFTCMHCNKNFGYKRNFRMHLKTHIDFNDLTTNRNVRIKCPLCEFSARFSTDYYSHVEIEHDINIAIENLEISCSDDFNTWFSNIQHETQTKFIVTKRFATAALKRVNYACHRSGFFMSKGVGKRNLKKQGSKKINGFCPASIKVSISGDGNHNITYVKTHVGHENELCHLSLTKSERQMLAKMIAMKIPFDTILDEIQDNINENSHKRLHSLTRKDLYNIESCLILNSKSESQTDGDDSIGINNWIEENLSSCVLFYKQQGTVLEDYPQLSEEDFVLIIMSEAQKVVLANYVQDCICIDRIHERNGHNFELHTLMVLDEFRRGLPCSFCISNRSDEVPIMLFFKCIKVEVGVISTNSFMSDMDPIYYELWKQVMVKTDFQLVCTWHVDQEWRKHLYLIEVKDKQMAAYKMLRTLMQKTGPSSFEKHRQECTCHFLNDPATIEYAKYFDENFQDNVKSWAHCYRESTGLNTNVSLERLHKSIRHIYLLRKSVQKLAKTLNSLMKLVKDHLFETYINLNITNVCVELSNRHKLSLGLNFNLVSKVGGLMWQIPSSSSSKIYTICENTISNCDCDVYCSDCKTCIHKYSCDCVDYSVRWNMCKHIHLLCMCIERFEYEDGKTQDNSSFEIIENQDSSESYGSLPVAQPAMPLSEEKDKLIDKVVAHINSIGNEEELALVDNIISSIDQALHTLR